EIKANKDIFRELWHKVYDVLKSPGPSVGVVDERTENLFIFCLKDMVKLLECFDGYESMDTYAIIRDSLEKDIMSFSIDQIKKIPELKISLDWIHRLISRLIYTVRLLKFASLGRSRIATMPIKVARGVSGP